MVWLNVASLVLGILAWLLPGLVSRKSKDKYLGSFLSLTACILALLCQILYHWHLVRIEDWTALMDITFSTVLASIVLVVVTLLLNIKLYKVK